MPSRDWQLRIADILQAVQDIEQFTQCMTFEEFSKNKMVVQSVLYNFVIIGEASANIPDEIQTLDPTIPWRKCFRIIVNAFSNCPHSSSSFSDLRISTGSIVTLTRPEIFKRLSNPPLGAM